MGNGWAIQLGYLHSHTCHRWTLKSCRKPQVGSDLHVKPYIIIARCPTSRVAVQMSLSEKATDQDQVSKLDPIMLVIMTSVSDLHSLCCLGCCSLDQWFLLSAKT